MVEFRTSPLFDRLQPSATVTVTQKARELRAAGRDVIALSVGEPDFDTPAHIRDAAKAAIDSGQTRYTAADGTPQLKDAITAKFARDNGLEYASAQVAVTTGGKFLIYASLLATLSPGDEVIVPAPYWVSYPDVVRLAGGTPVIVDCPEADGFLPSPDRIAEAMTERTRWLILNSPSNPTGSVIPDTRLREIAEIARRYPNLWILTDDIYEHLAYGVDVTTIAAVAPDVKDRVLIVNGASKAYAMTGWRIGFGAGPEPLIKAIGKILGQTTSNPCSVSQAATVAALNGDHSFLDNWRSAFRERRDLVVDGLNRIGGLSARRPDGAFYAFPSCANLLGGKGPSGAINDDIAFCRQLLEAEGVATVPGTAFGAPGHFRVSYATGTEQLETAIERISRFVSSIG